MNSSEQVPRESGGQEIPPEKWQALEVLWKTILGLEASIDSSRLSMDGLRGEMEAAFKKALTVEEKLNACKPTWPSGTRPRAASITPSRKCEFIHRAHLVSGCSRTEEARGDLQEPRRAADPLPGLDQVREQLEHLQKDRQVLLRRATRSTRNAGGAMPAALRGHAFPFAQPIICPPKAADMARGDRMKMRIHRSGSIWRRESSSNAQR